MTEFLTMSDAYEALLCGDLVPGDVFTATSQPGRVFMVYEGNKIRLVPETELLAVEG